MTHELCCLLSIRSYNLCNLVDNGDACMLTTHTICTQAYILHDVGIHTTWCTYTCTDYYLILKNCLLIHNYFLTLVMQRQVIQPRCACTARAVLRVCVFVTRTSALPLRFS